jgi:hypothetical protein
LRIGNPAYDFVCVAAGRAFWQEGARFLPVGAARAKKTSN